MRVPTGFAKCAAVRIGRGSIRSCCQSVSPTVRTARDFQAYDAVLHQSQLRRMQRTVVAPRTSDGDANSTKARAVSESEWSGLRYRDATTAAAAWAVCLVVGENRKILCDASAPRTSTLPATCPICTAQPMHARRPAASLIKRLLARTGTRHHCSDRFGLRHPEVVRGFWTTR